MVNEETKKVSSVIGLPADMGAIASFLAEKYDLKEADETIVDSLRKKGFSPEMEIVDISASFLRGEISQNDLAVELRKRLKLSQIKAEALSKDIGRRLDAVPQSTSSERKGRRRDIYREPINE